MPDRMPERMPERMSERIADRMPDQMSDRTSERMTDRMSELEWQIKCQIECEIECQIKCQVEFVSEWLHYSETLERTSLQRPFPCKELSQHFTWMGNNEVVAPIDLLHFVLDHWQNYATDSLIGSVMPWNFFKLSIS